jgi:hypothetical protein
VLRQNPSRAIGPIAQRDGRPCGCVAGEIRVICLIKQFAGGSRVVDQSDHASGARGVAVGTIAHGKGFPYIGDGARGQLLSQKNEQFAGVKSGGNIAHDGLRDDALISRLKLYNRFTQRKGACVFRKRIEGET